MNCIQTYVQTQSLGTIIAPVNGSWIQAYAEYIGLVTPINDSWLQAICEEFGITEPLYGSWTIALANYYGISQPRGTWWCALADAAYVPPGGTPPFQWDLDTRLWEVESRQWDLGLAVWSPASFSNVQNWWTADLGVTEAGGSVSAWADQINGFSMQQPSAANEPTRTQSATLNNQDVISFNGIDQYLYTATATASWVEDLTMLSVMNLIDVKTGGTVMGGVLVGAGSRWWVDTLNGDLRTFALDLISNSGGGSFNYESPAVTGAKAIKQRYDGSTGQGTYAINTLTESNSTSGTIGTTTMISTASVALGATLNDTGGSVFGGRYVQVEVAEQVWIHGTPTATEMNEWKTYVNTKYGTIIV
tara:strand:+ start:1007 stop:2089 length:1083 start_codon:yes stop_codon:yes gene_type:complete